jgi:hypothetical protein
VRLSDFSVAIFLSAATNSCRLIAAVSFEVQPAAVAAVLKWK